MPFSTRNTSSPTPITKVSAKKLLGNGKATASDLKTKWTAAEEAAIIATLLGQKAVGASDSGFKPTVWKIVVDDLADVSPVGMSKDVSQCKSHYQWLKGEYKIVRVLRGLSGFGWDEGKQCVTVPLEVWDKYLMANPKAKPFKKKPFPLYDDIAELCDDVIATGAGVFHGTGPTGDDASDGDEESVESDDEGDQEGDRESNKNESSGRQEINWSPSPPRKPQVLKHKGCPTCEVSQRPKKCQRLSGADALVALSEAVESVAAGFAADDGRNPSIQTMPQRVTRAIGIVEHDEAGLDDNSKLDAIALFQCDPKYSITYLAIKNQELRRKWLQCQIDMEQASSSMFEWSQIGPVLT
ncbi:hypothetical protein K439DRAFT_1623876 [Ramaria rubella]|nr:hypothetical protein K439DRAFT_1623876 [Ramaria rubella]